MHIELNDDYETKLDNIRKGYGGVCKSVAIRLLIHEKDEDMKNQPENDSQDS